MKPVAEVSKENTAVVPVAKPSAAMARNGVVEGLVKAQQAKTEALLKGQFVVAQEMINASVNAWFEELSEYQDRLLTQRTEQLIAETEALLAGL